MLKTRLSLLSLLALVALLLAACAPAATPSPTPETPPQPPQAIGAAQAWLAEKLGVAVESIQILSSEHVDWTDSCLQLGGAEESCAQAITPGWQMIFKVGEQEYEVRSDENGEVMRMPEQATPDPNDPLAGSKWTLVSFGEAGAETPVVAGSTVTLVFSADGRMGGNGGCNSYGTAYHIEDGQIKHEEITSTLMACADQAVMDQETRYYEALRTSAGFEVTGDTLTIQYGEGQGVLTYQKAE